MQINTITEVTLTKEQIEEAIKEYISRRSFNFRSGKCSIDFKYIDIAEEDRGPYRPIMRVNSAIVKF